MKHLKAAVLLLASLCLSGCSVAAFFLCDNPDADLVVVNNSSQAVWSIELDYGTQTSGVQSTHGRALMERGESHGLRLEDGAEQVTVILSDRLGRELVRQPVDFAGERLYLTLERNGSLSVSEEWPNG